MSSPVIVYLDSQDYSRFGDVLRGKSDPATERLFNDLKARRSSGKAVFTLSMPLLGELLQYNAEFRETTLQKAEAVEQLCGPNALIFPTRLVAREIAVIAKGAGLVALQSLPPVWNSDRYWYPNVGNLLEGFKANVLAQAQKEVSSFPLPNRAARRTAQKVARKLDIRELVQQAAPEMAEKFGLPVEAITGSLGALLRGTISSADASRQLFKSICEPRTFVELYFERLENDRSLPLWMRRAGESLADCFANLKTTVEPIIRDGGAAQTLRKLVAAKRPDLGAMAFKFAQEDLLEFGLDDDVVGIIKADPDLAKRVHSTQTFANVLEAYILQIAGVSASNASIEHSFGGDLLHSLYLPHVDLWRGDRRFSATVSAAMPNFKERVVRKLGDLPAAIDVMHSTKSVTV